MRAAKKPIKIKKHVTQDMKSKFRRSKKWKDFRLRVRKEQKIDPITTSPLSTTFNLHHMLLDPEHYTDISDESHFIGLNATSHDLVHFMYNCKQGWRNGVLALITILKQMDKINGVRK